MDHRLDHYTGQSQDSPYCHSFLQCGEGDVLSPTGFGGGEEFFGLSLTRQQIKEHNCKTGWQQWITLKGKVYDTTSFRDHFLAYNKKKKAAENAQSEQKVSSDSASPESFTYFQEGDSEYSKLGPLISNRISDTIDDLLLLQGHDFDQQNRGREAGAEYESADDDAEEEYNEEDSTSENSSSDTEFLWKYNVITALQKTGLSIHEVETEIRPFMIGTLQNLPRWKYWDSVRGDILALCDDLTSKDSTDMGRYEHEYLTLLQRWLRKYKDIDPAEKTSAGDGNISAFFLTEDPDLLREWVKTSPPFDTDLPDSGAWASTELLLSPLGDTHDVFSAALRSHNSNNDPFSHEIQGKVAWTELPQDAIKNDQMTHQQQLVYESRLRRGDHVHDPAFTKKRREQLGHYFRRKYHYSEKTMAQYLLWTTVMEQNQKDLDTLCHICS